MPFLSGYLLRKQITIDNANVDSALTDFPLLLKITADADIGAAIDAGGLNIRFTASDGETELQYERQSFSVAGGEATGIFWVKVPTISGVADTTIFVYYKGGVGVEGASPEDAWNSDYVAVYHLEESPAEDAPQILDSTQSGFHGTCVGGMTGEDSIASHLGNGLDVDGSGEYVSMPNNASGDQVTVELLAKVDGPGPAYHRFIEKGANSQWTMAYDLSGTGTGTRPFWCFQNQNHIEGPAAGIDDGGWHQIVGRVNSLELSILVDGVQSASSMRATPAALNNENVYISSFGAGGGFHLPYTADEIRISSTYRSNDWLKFSYHNIFAADNEISVGAEQEASAQPPVPGTRTLVRGGDGRRLAVSGSDGARQATRGSDGRRLKISSS